MKQYYSIKQMADMLGIPKQRVYRYIKKQCIKSVSSDVVKGNTIPLYDYQCLQVLQGILGGVSDSVSNSTSDSVSHDIPSNDKTVDYLLSQIDFLQNELQAKNKQIEELHTIVNQCQQLQAITEQKLKAIEDKSNNEMPNPPEDGQQKLSVWQRIFKREPKY